MGRWLWMGGIGLQRFLGDRGGLEFGCAGAQFDCFVRAQIGMAGSGDHWNSALLDLCHRRRHQSCAGKHDDKISGSAKGKRLVAKTLGKTFVAISQLQCSRKPTRVAVTKLMKKPVQKRTSTAWLRHSPVDGKPESRQ